MYRGRIRNGLLVSKETLHHLTECDHHFIEDAVIEGIRLPAIPTLDENGKIIALQELGGIQYTVDKPIISTIETATITITDPAIVTVEIDGQEYIVDDGVVEYSNENVGKHLITLKAEGYYTVDIEIEVIA